MTRPDYTPKPTMIAGIRFKSRLESRWFLYLKALGLQIKYEPLAFSNGYSPDFKIKAAETIQDYLEIKPARVTKEYLKHQLFPVAEYLWKQEQAGFYLCCGSVYHAAPLPTIFLITKKICRQVPPTVYFHPKQNLEAYQQACRYRFDLE